MFGLSQAPENTTAQSAADPAGSAKSRNIPAPRPAPDVHCQISPEVVALVDQLQATWTAKPEAAPQAAAGFSEPETVS